MGAHGRERVVDLKRWLRFVPRVRAIVSLIVLLPACQPGPAELPSPTPVGEHLRFWSDETSVICEGTLPYMDGYVAELGAIHGVEDVVVDYFHTDADSDLYARECNESYPHSVGCSWGTNVISSFLPHEHELVHAVRSRFGLSHRFIEEGVANAWGQAIDRAPESSVDLNTAIDSPTGALDAGGRFAAYLLDRHGPAPLVQAALDTSYDAPRGSLEGAFAAAGLDLAEEIEAFEQAEWACGRSQYRDDSIECAVARSVDCSLADDEGSVTAYLGLGCGDPETIGPRQGAVWSAVSFEQPRYVNLRVSTETTQTSDEVEVSFVGCRAGCEDNIFTIPGNTDLELFLPDGHYLIRASRPFDTDDDGVQGVEVTLHHLCQ